MGVSLLPALQPIPGNDSLIDFRNLRYAHRAFVAAIRVPASFHQNALGWLFLSFVFIEGGQVAVHIFVEQVVRS